MKKNKIVFIILIIICIVTITIILSKINLKENNTKNDEQNEISNLKNEVGITGNSDLYDINTEYDGNKILSIKPDIQYKIAFSGIIKNSNPNINEIDTIFEEHYPKNTGIWIDATSREKFQQMLKECAKNEYEISEEGYLRIKSEKNQIDIDEKLKKMINGNKKYIVTVSGIYYEADTVTGEILDNFYEDLDPYQASKTVGYDNDIIVFLSTNVAKKLTSEEILKELISYI